MAVNRPDDPLLSVEQVCVWLGGKSPAWVHKNWRQCFPEVTYVGRKLHWRQSVIAQYLDRNTAGVLDVR